MRLALSADHAGPPSALAAEHGPGEERPPDEKAESADGRHRAEPARAPQRQQVEATGEQDRPRDEEPARRAFASARPPSPRRAARARGTSGSGLRSRTPRAARG